MWSISFDQHVSEFVIAFVAAFDRVDGHGNSFVVFISALGFTKIMPCPCLEAIMCIDRFEKNIHESAPLSMITAY